MSSQWGDLVSWRSCVFLAFWRLSHRGQQSEVGISRCVYQPPEDYLDILVAAGGGGWASHLIHAAQRRCSNEVKSGWRGGTVGGMKGTERVEGGGAFGTSCYMLQHVHHGHITDNLCHLEVEGPCAAC